MTLDIKKIIAGAISGFFAALVVDVNAWSKTEDNFDWLLALKRWIAGALTGIGAALGISATGN